MKTHLMTKLWTVLMTDPPEEIVEPTTKLFQLIKYMCLIAGGIVILIGLIQFGTSQMNQDPAGRQKALYVLLGGIVITAAPFILMILIPSLTF